MDDFSKTRRGTKFFDLDLPKIASQLERIAESLEKKNLIEEKRLLLEQRKFIKENRSNEVTEKEEPKLGDNLSS
jgi:hypothetical protein